MPRSNRPQEAWSIDTALLGQHGWMPERVAQYKRPNSQLLCVGSNPRSGHHRLVHWLPYGKRWRQVVHAREPDEPCRLGRLGFLNQLRHTQSHLWQKQVEFHSPPLSDEARCLYDLKG